MNNLGPAAEFLRISEHYRQMSDGELLDLAQDPSELTDVAQQALASEISHRGLTIPSAKPALRPNAVPLPDPADSNSPEYDDDRQLVEICTVWSQRDALQLQTLLDNAGIPFFMGPENATGVDAVTSNFADGVSVRVMQVGVPWARQAMQTYEPQDDQTPKDQAEPEDLPVQCPKCRSTEVVFDELVPDESAPAANAPQKFKWICESCGHEWEDDGIVKEA
jgi:DNA-directed RNA polymerase subunit M/transcription elongation factor TFIIS